MKNANDALKGRVLEISLADLNKNEEYSFRKVKLRVDEVQGKNCLTNFHGMDMTSDKLRSMVRKWQVRTNKADPFLYLQLANCILFICQQSKHGEVA